MVETKLTIISVNGTNLLKYAETNNHLINVSIKPAKANTNQLTPNVAALKYRSKISVAKTNSIIIRIFIPNGVELYESVKKPTQKAEI